MAVRHGAKAPASLVDWSFAVKDNKINMQRFVKVFLREQLYTMVAGRKLVAVAHAPNLQRAELLHVRKELKAVGGYTKQVKNTIASAVLQQAGFEQLVPLIRGRALIAAGDADVATAKVLLGLSKEIPNLLVLGAVLDERLLLQRSQMESLSKLPEPEVVHASLIAALSPGTALQVPNPAAHLLAILQAREAQASNDTTDGSE